jgi:hypothetical protein
MPGADATRLAATAARFSRHTAWEAEGATPLRFDAGHPQGMVRVEGRWWISTVDLPTTSGSVLVVDDDGTLLDRVPVGDEVRFHPGGLDHDGEALWVASSEYRPRSTAVVERLATTTTGAGPLRPEPAFAVADHVGAVVRLGPDGDLVGWTWGSRRFLRWRTDGTPVAEARNPGHFVDHQDGQWVGDDVVLCAGVATVMVADGPRSLGGIGLLRASDLAIVREAPFPHHSPATGRAATQNPIFAEVVGDRMVVHLLPDDGAGTILRYSTPLAGQRDDRASH